MYKLPGHYSASVAERGCLYFFITSNSVSSQWSLSERTLNDSMSFAGQTLAQAYFDANQLKEDRVLVAYNDEPPNEKGNSKYGHLKGVVVADKRSGFWLVHSVPLYPNITCELCYFLKLLIRNSHTNLINWFFFYFNCKFSANPNDYYYPTTGMVRMIQWANNNWCK